MSLVIHLVHNGDMKGVSAECCQAACLTGSPVSLRFSRETPCPVADKTAVELKLEGNQWKAQMVLPTGLVYSCFTAHSRAGVTSQSHVDANGFFRLDVHFFFSKNVFQSAE